VELLLLLLLRGESTKAALATAVETKYAGDHSGTGTKPEAVGTKHVRSVQSFS
jgi:hypothetical protein